MCNACGFVCCASDMFSGCGCDHCDCEQCWSEEEDEAADFEEWIDDADGGHAGGSQAARRPGASAAPAEGAPRREPRAGKYEVNGIIVAETAKAILLDDGGTPQWLPKKGLVIERRRDNTVDVAMPEWLAREKGFV